MEFLIFFFFVANSEVAAAAAPTVNHADQSVMTAA